MSSRTERSAWSPPEDVDFMENADQEVQLVSTSTDSNSKTHNSIRDAQRDDENEILTPKTRSLAKTLDLAEDYNQKNQNDKLYSSFEDLLLSSKEKLGPDVQFNEKKDLNFRGSAFSNSKRHKKPNQKYGHVQSKIKHYFCAAEKELKSTAVPDLKIEKNKEAYLEEINKHLTKELEEKNAILLLLQENYERLLFKYAEAQNRIDELRFKCLAENSNPKPSSKHARNSHRFRGKESHASKIPEIKCRRPSFDGVSTPEDQESFNSPNNIMNPPPCRPASLPLDGNMKVVDRDAIMMKATTPTDSEGLSSVITSMSGHSKILNSLDEENKKSKSFKYSNSSSFILEGSTNMNDPIDKVKNWQNSLPPLEQIETPETALYNVFPNDAYGSLDDAKRHDSHSPNVENDYAYLDESCPPSWRDDSFPVRKRGSSRKTTSHSGTTTKRSGAEENQNQNVCSSPDMDAGGSYTGSGTHRSRNNGLFKRKTRRRGRKTPLLRCSSLPIYDHGNVRSGKHKNGIYIPPLDLGNVTQSDDESYCQQDENYWSRSNPSSGTTSRGCSNDRFVQTPQSASSCKKTTGGENFFSRVPRLTTTTTTDKSTSITPERHKPAEFFGRGQRISDFLQEGKRSGSSRESGNHCNICGESIGKNKNYSRNRSNSYESVHETQGNLGKAKNSPGNVSRPPFKRSMSFGSETTAPKFCSHEDRIAKNFQLIPSQESLENFEVYASSLKARSQVVMKALTAHINNS